MTSKLNLVFSASSYDTFEVCPQKFDFAQNKRKTVPVSQKSKGLDFGGLTHTGLEVYFNLLAEGKVFADRMHASLQAMRAAASDPDNSNIDIEDELPTILNAVEQSCDFWRHEDEHLEILAVEEPFDYLLHEDEFLRIIISGKIDLLVNKPSIGGSSAYTNLPFDHKSYQRAFPVDRLNNQFINYCVPTGSNYLIYNGVGLQKTLSPSEKFRRIPLSYDPAFIEQWKRNVTGVIIHQYLECVKENFWPMRPTSCRKFGRLCEFHAVCDASGDDTKLWKLESLYVDREHWDKYKESEAE